MSYEFKKLSEVDAVESISENASVLVENSGSIVRYPASAIGGGSGFDIVIGPNDTHETTETFKFYSGDFNTLYNKLESMQPVTVYFCYYENNDMKTDLIQSINPHADSCTIYFKNLEWYLSIFPDNSISKDYPISPPV